MQAQSGRGHTMGLPVTTHTMQGCPTTPTVPTTTEAEEWLEQQVAAGFRVWQIMFFCFAGLLTIVILLCCCIRFRIPRTKQEIEADYVRKKLTRKFQKQLKIIQNAEMDDMDLKKALDRIRAEIKSDTESLAQSEALSGATLSSGCNCPSPGHSLPEAHVGISLEDIRPSNKIGAKLSTFMEGFSKLRSKKQ